MAATVAGGHLDGTGGRQRREQREDHLSRAASVGMSLSGHKKGEKYCARCVMLGTGACVCMCVAACRVQLRLTGSDRHGTGTPKKRIGMKITKRQAVRPLLRYVVAGIAASQTERWGAGWRALCSSAVLCSHALVRCPFRQPVGVHGHGRAVPGSRSCAGPCACPCRPPEAFSADVPPPRESEAGRCTAAEPPKCA